MPRLPTSQAFVVVVFFGLFALASRNATDPDMWWHLRTGQYILEHRAVPRSDPFSYTRRGERWVAHEWLSEILMYEIQHIAGWAGLIISFAAVVSAAFYLLYLRCGPYRYVAGISALFGAWATQMVWGVRPQVISLLLTSLWLLILERSDRRPKLLWWTLPLTLLWVNLHAGFALGLALFGWFIIAALVERGLGHSRQHASWLRTAAFIFLLDLCTVPLNPNGGRMYVYPIETLRSAAMQSYIVEWASPNFHRAEYWPFLLIVLAAIVVLARSPKHVQVRELLLVASFYAALCAIRMIPLFVFIAVPIIANRLRAVPLNHSFPPARARTRTAVNMAIVLAMAGFAGIHVLGVIEKQAQAETQEFPAAAVQYLQTHALTGPIFNLYDWGGYLIWKQYPSVPVFVDGRADLYGEKFLDEYAATINLKGEWQNTLQRWHVRSVLIRPDSPLAQGLRSEPGWTVIHEDSQAIIFVTAEGAQPPKTGAVTVVRGMQQITHLSPVASYHVWTVQLNFPTRVRASEGTKVPKSGASICLEGSFELFDVRPSS
jgi:hypothetical protein